MLDFDRLRGVDTEPCMPDSWTPCGPTINECVPVGEVQLSKPLLSHAEHEHEVTEVSLTSIDVLQYRYTSISIS